MDLGKVERVGESVTKRKSGGNEWWRFNLQIWMVETVWARLPGFSEI